MTKKTGPLEAHAPTAAQWTARWEGAGQTAFAGGRHCQFDADQLVASVESLERLATSDPQVFALIKGKGLDHAFFAGLSPIAARLKALVQGQPPDRRKVVLVPPADKQTVDAAYEDLLFARSIATAAAQASGRVDDVKVLGRGVRVAHRPGSVRDGIQLFVTNFDSCEALLEDGGFGRPELARLAAFLPKLEQILTAKGDREKSRDASSDEMEMLGLAIESALHLVRARAASALQKQPLLLARTLAHLPRRPERRAKATYEGGGTGGEGTGAGSGAEPAQQPEAAK